MAERGPSFGELISGFGEQAANTVRFRLLEWRVPGVVGEALSREPVLHSNLASLDPRLLKMLHVVLAWQAARKLAVNRQEAELIGSMIDPHYSKQCKKETQRHHVGKDTIAAIDGLAKDILGTKSPWLPRIINQRVTQLNTQMNQLPKPYL